jgi:uncharacterized damage-inducible protein DinB
MTEIDRIADQLERAFKEDAWCGSSLQEVLAAVTSDCAAARPLEGAHTIWEIVRHVTGWKDAVRRRLAGEAARLPVEGDWPPLIDTGPSAWKETLAKLQRAHDDLLAAVRELTDDRLEMILITEKSRESGGGVSCYVTLHGTVQHDLYHAAQIALLKKSCG